MIITATLTFLAWLYWLDWVHDDIEPIEEEKEEEKKDIWQHPYILAAGLTKPLEECELEEVSLEGWDVIFRGNRYPETVVSEEVAIHDLNSRLDD